MARRIPHQTGETTGASVCNELLKHCLSSFFVFEISTAGAAYPLHIFDMARQCRVCTRYWGRKHSACPPCKFRKLCLLRVLSHAEDPCMMILAFASTPLRKHYSLCYTGTLRNCRCENCRGPSLSEMTGGTMVVQLSVDPIFQKLRRQCGHGRRIAARWVYLLAGAVAMRPDHGRLSGLLIADGVGRGPHVFLFNSSPFLRLPRRTEVPYWVWRWCAALFLEYVQDRNDALTVHTRAIERFEALMQPGANGGL